MKCRLVGEEAEAAAYRRGTRAAVEIRGAQMLEPPGLSGGSGVVAVLIGAVRYFSRLRRRTASASRYSICPFMERKSSSAQAAISSHRVGERRSRSC